MFTFLRSLDLSPVEWSQAVAAKGGVATNQDIVQTGLGSANGVIVLLTGDDEVRLRPELQTPSDEQAESYRAKRGVESGKGDASSNAWK